jgi:hypothetical protein
MESIEVRFEFARRLGLKTVTEFIEQCGKNFWSYHHTQASKAETYSKQKAFFPFHIALPTETTSYNRNKFSGHNLRPHEELVLYRNGEIHTEMLHCDITAWNSWHVVAYGKTRKPLVRLREGERTVRGAEGHPTS